MLVDKLKCDGPDCTIEFSRPKGAEKYQKHACSSTCAANILISVLDEIGQETAFMCAPLENGDDNKRFGINIPKAPMEKEKGDLS